MSEIIAGKVMTEYLDLIINHPSAMKYSIKASIVRWTVWILPAVAMLFTACENQSRGFVLPEGDAMHGKVLFQELNCTRCHSIGDIAWTGSARYDDVHVKLGGDVTHLKTYGELVTSVINPSHKISQQDTSHQKLTLIEGMSKMELPRYNEIMTVQELVDIVAFLQSEYKLVVPDVTYPYHGF